MLVTLAVLVLLGAVLASAERERREARLRAGAPGWGDLARITGIADRRELVRMPGVSLAGDGRPRFDPARRAALPAHLTALLVDHPIGHGVCLSLGIATLGAAVKLDQLPLLGWLVTFAACYQLLSRLYALVVWAEGRAASP